METAKQKAIREAYGDKWEIAKEFVDENGWIDRFKQSAYLNVGNWGVENPLPIINFLGFNDGGGLEYHYDKYRPKSLQGIQNNNGWINIKSEADLPQTRGKNDVWLLDRITEEIIPASTNLLNSEEVRKFWVSQASHYQPIVKPLKPVY